jgi:hypothetical protein
MLKWVGKRKSGGAVLGFGLEAREIELLKQGRPIVASVSLGGVKYDIVIHYGETQAELLEQIRGQKDVVFMPQSVN